MGVSFSNLNEPHSHVQAQSSTVSNRHQTCIPLYPGREQTNNCNKVQWVPTCDHEMLHNNPGVASPRFMSRGMGPFGGGFVPQRRPRFGHDIWDGGPGFEHGGRADRICGYCGDLAHPGPCDGGRQRGGGWSRQRYMRRGGGGGYSRVDLAGGLNNLSAALGHGFEMSGGCGRTCPANDGGIRLKGSVGDHDIDLKLGGQQRCPCDENGGCEASHRRAKSRSRSRKKRERRGRRRARKQEKESDEESSDDEQSRGRKRERPSLRDGDGASPGLQPRVTRLEDDVERLNNGWQYLKDRLPAQPSLGLPGGVSFEPADYGQGVSEFDGISLGTRRRRRVRPMGGLGDLGDLGLPLREDLNRYSAGLGRSPQEADGFGVDADFDRTGLGHGDGLGIGRGRPGLGRENGIGADFAGLENIEEEPPMRMPRGMGRRTPGGYRGRRLGGLGGLRGLRPMTCRTGRPEDESMANGRSGMPARDGVGSDKGNWDFARQPIGLNRAAHGTPGNNLNIPKTQGYCPPDSRKARAGNTQNVPRLRQRGQSG